MCAALLALCGREVAAQDRTGAYAVTWTAGTVDLARGGELEYQLMVPAARLRAARLPLVIVLHGERGVGFSRESSDSAAFAALTSDRIRRAYPAFFAVPFPPPGASWTDADVRSAIRAVVDAIGDAWEIDQSRVYLVAEGAAAARGGWALLADDRLEFAAAILVSAPGDPDRADAYAATPLWFFMPTSGAPAIENARALVGRMWEQSGAEIRYTEYRAASEGDVGPPWEEPRLTPWLFSHQREQGRVQR